MNELSTFRRDEHGSRVIRLDGLPNEQTKKNEPNIWRRFLRAISPFAKSGADWAKYTGELGIAYAEAEVANRISTADRTAAEAAEASARADASRQAAVKSFNAEVDAIFADDGLPEAAKLLKLAKLFDANPDLSQQVEKVTAIIEKLAITRGSRMQIGLTDTGQPVVDKDG